MYPLFLLPGDVPEEGNQSEVDEKQIIKSATVYRIAMVFSQNQDRGKPDSKAEFERQFGSEIDAIYGDVLRKYKSMGLLLEEKGRIFLSRDGIHVSNSVMADFLP